MQVSSSEGHTRHSEYRCICEHKMVTKMIADVCFGSHVSYVQIHSVLYSHTPYNRKYWRGIIFGGFVDFLVILAILNPPILCQPRRLPEKAWRLYRNWQIYIRQLQFSSNPPNIIPTNISGYTVELMHLHTHNTCSTTKENSQHHIT